jgi:hypothetical protein
MTGLIALGNLLRGPFSESTYGFEATKEFALHIERGASRNDAESVFCAAMFVKFVSGTPSLERAEFRGVPTKALSLLLGYLHENPHVVIPFPNLQRLYVESTPLRSPKPLLGDLDNLLRGRKEFGLPMRFVEAKVNCETLIPIAEHSAFLVAWERLVGEDVKVVYSRDIVEALPRRGLRMVFFRGENGEEEDDEEQAEDVESGGEIDLDWESLNSGQWPKTASEMKGSTGDQPPIPRELDFSFSS